MPAANRASSPRPTSSPTRSTPPSARPAAPRCCRPSGCAGSRSGPGARSIFESFETMLFQVQEMLLTEKGGDEQLADELAAYNPLIPQGARAGGDGACSRSTTRSAAPACWASWAAWRTTSSWRSARAARAGVPEGDVERTREDGKTSSVHFLHFPLTAAQAAAFRDPAVRGAGGLRSPEIRPPRRADAGDPRGVGEGLGVTTPLPQGGGGVTASAANLPAQRSSRPRFSLKRRTPPRPRAFRRASTLLLWEGFRGQRLPG